VVLDSRIGVAVFALLVACQPLHDLDAASSGVRGATTDAEATASSGGVSVSGQPPVGHSPSPQVSSTETASMVTPPTDTTHPDASPFELPTPQPSSVPAPPPANTQDAPGEPVATVPEEPVPSAPALGGMGGASGVGPSQGDAGVSLGGGSAGDGSGGAGGMPLRDPPIPTDENGDAVELPIDLPQNPVTGTFTVSSEAVWEVNGAFVPTFEIKTPSGSYWVVKSLGQIVSMVDTDEADQRQWIDFSSGFRPLRGLPSFASFDETGTMTTVLDADSQTPTHLRLKCTSDSGSWRLVYDFYPTHVTITVNAAPMPYGMAYRGVPGGALDDGDRFVFADGVGQGALLSSVTDLPGPAEWAYVTDTELSRSLLMIQHGDDDLTDRYQVKDNDSSLFSFGDGSLTQLPMRFSFALLDSADHEAVAARAGFIIDAIR